MVKTLKIKLKNCVPVGVDQLAEQLTNNLELEGSNLIATSTQHNDSQHNDVQHSYKLNTTISIMAEDCHAECHI